MFTSYVQTILLLLRTCNHTSSKSLSPLSNDSVDDTLIQLMILFVHNAFLQLVDVLDFGPVV